MPSESQSKGQQKRQQGTKGVNLRKKTTLQRERKLKTNPVLTRVADVAQQANLPFLARPVQGCVYKIGIVEVSSNSQTYINPFGCCFCVSQSNILHNIITLLSYECALKSFSYKAPRRISRKHQTLSDTRIMRGCVYNKIKYNCYSKTNNSCLARGTTHNQKVFGFE